VPLRSAAEPLRVGFHEGTRVQAPAGLGIGLDVAALIAERGSKPCEVDAPPEGICLTSRMRRIPPAPPAS
jgi:hypothetical protein